MALSGEEQTITIALADRLVLGDGSALAPVFAGRGIATPSIRWSPACTDLSARQLTFLLDYWNRLRGETTMASAAQIEPIEMRPALGYVCLLDVLDGGLDYYYRVYGSDVAHCAGADLTGTHLSSYVRARWMLVFHAAIYRAAVLRSEPLLNCYEPTSDIATERWERLILPLSGSEGEVARLLVGKVPMRRRMARRDPS